MVVEMMFHVYEYINCEGKRLMNGRVINDIKLSDDLIIINNLDIDFWLKNCNKDEILNVCSEVKYEKIKINKIYSYGRCWEELPSVMSAQLEYSCDELELNSDLVCRIVKDDK